MKSRRPNLKPLLSLSLYVMCVCVCSIHPIMHTDATMAPKCIDNRRRLPAAECCFFSFIAETFNFFFSTGHVRKSCFAANTFLRQFSLVSQTYLPRQWYIIFFGLIHTINSTVDGIVYNGCYTCVYTFLRATCSHLIYIRLVSVGEHHNRFGCWIKNDLTIIQCFHVGRYPHLTYFDIGETVRTYT